MTSPHTQNPESDQESLEQKIDRIRERVRQIYWQYCPNLAAAHEERDTRIRAAQQLVDEANQLVAVGDPPTELLTALRSPAGAIRRISITVLGKKVVAVLRPIGYPCPAREHAVWRQLHELVEQDAA